MKTFALALGGGGARGLAHIAVIEALDEMGMRPTAIAGTSIGAMIGAAYAAGMRGKDIRHHVIAFAHDWSQTRRRLMTARAGNFGDLLSGRLSQATQIDPDKFCEQFMPAQVPDDFSQLAIPFIAMATDLHRRSELAIASGPLRQPLAASIAIAQPPARGGGGQMQGQKIGLATSLQRGYAAFKRNFTAAAEKMPESDYGFKPGSTPAATVAPSPGPPLTCQRPARPARAARPSPLTHSPRRSSPGPCAPPRSVRSSAPRKLSKPRSKKSLVYYLATLLEEVFEQVRSRGFRQPAIDLRAMVAAR